MNKWAKDQDLTNVTVILAALGVHAQDGHDSRQGQSRLWHALRRHRQGRVIEAWSEEPGLCDNHGDDPYGISAQETLQQYLEQKDVEKAA